jgi:hypothetical protein
MKMVKSLLLTGAAGLITVAGAHAADLPVKAKPVEYVKICSIYGAGFYYIPGTDTCIKIGGYLRFEADFNAGGTFAPPVGPSGNAMVHNWAQDRTSTEALTRQRMLWTYDVRTQTEYGTLRAYARTGIQWTTSTDSVLAGSGVQSYLDRAFIQFGGFTFGKGVSFYDGYTLGLHSYSSYQLGSDGTAGNGTPMVAYTFTLGNGFAGTLAFEDSGARGKSVVNVNGSGYFSLNNASGTGWGPLAATGAPTFFDGIANLRVDQVWGYASVSGAVHQVKGMYYGVNGNTSPFGGDPGLIANGHPGDKLGFAGQASAVLNLPWNKGDMFGVAANYGVGALGYVDGSGLGSVAIFNGSVGGQLGLGFLTDAVYGTGSALELTTAWSVTAGLEHYWTPALRSSVYGGFSAVNYNANATALICGPASGLGKSAGAAVGFTPTNCSPNFSFFQVGSRTIWNPVPNLDLGLEVMYNQVQTAFAGSATTTGALPGYAAPATFSVHDTGVLSAVFRAQRNFWP